MDILGPVNNSGRVLDWTLKESTPTMGKFLLLDLSLSLSKVCNIANWVQFVNNSNAQIHILLQQEVFFSFYVDFPFLY